MADGGMTMPLLTTLRAHQLQNGLRYGDYERYRSYCTRRLHRVRRSTGSTNGKGRYRRTDVVKAVLASRTEGEDEASAPSPGGGKKRGGASVAVGDPRVLLVPLVTAERAWAEAMELRAGLDGSESKGARRRMLRRLARAVREADRLSAACEAAASPGTALEARGYACFMKGTRDMEAGRFDEALRSLVEAKRLYGDVLGGMGDPEERRIVRDLADELQPSIDYCSFRSGAAGGDGSALEAARLRERLSAPRGALATAADVPGAAEAAADAAKAGGVPVDWLGVTISLRNDRVVQSLAAADARQAEISAAVDGGEMALDAVISAYDEVIKHFNDARAQLRSGNKRLDSPHSDAELDALEKYIRSLEIRGTIRRMGIMLRDTALRISEGKGAAREADMVRMLDSVVQYTHDLAALRGIADPGTTPCPETARILMLRSRRCAHLARAFVDGKQFAEALALVERAGQLADQALEMDVEADEGNIEAKGSRPFKEELRALRCTVVAKYNIHDAEVAKDLAAEAGGISLGGGGGGGAAGGARRRVPLCDRLDSLDLPGRSGQPAHPLGEFPPQPACLPAKPIFFDLAWDHARYPKGSEDGQDNDNERASASSAPAAGAQDGDGGEDNGDGKDGKAGGWFSSFWK